MYFGIAKEKPYSRQTKYFNDTHEEAENYASRRDCLEAENRFLTGVACSISTVVCLCNIENVLNFRCYL